jgi:maltose/moltooligosaccharide transporter
VHHEDTSSRANARHRRSGVLWIVVGLVGFGLVRYFALDQQLYILFAGTLLWGLALVIHSASSRPGMFNTIMRDLHDMPDTMRRLIPVQFFSWLALFSMWIYTTAAVTQVHFGSADPTTEAYNQGANWVGVLFAAYSGFAALAAIVIPFLVSRIGLKQSHLINLCLGGVALMSFRFIRDPLYMGIFNFFIVIPQLVAASVLGFLLKALFGGAPIQALVLGGVSFVIAGLFVLRVPQP